MTAGLLGVFGYPVLVRVLTGDRKEFTIQGGAGLPSAFAQPLSRDGTLVTAFMELASDTDSSVEKA